MKRPEKAASKGHEATSNPHKLILMMISALSMIVSLVWLDGARAQTSDGGIPPGYKIIEEDIQVPKFSILGPFSTSLWPNGVIPFEFDALVSQANQNAMLAAIAQVNGLGKINFQRCVSDNCSGIANFVHIQNSTSNNSAVGLQGGRQIVNIFNWNFTFIMAHELLHVCGFWHEQSRVDRDTFVTINTANIQAGQAFNFDKHSEAGTYGYYDFDSVMHYGQCAFSTDPNCGPGTGTQTITVLPPNNAQWQNAIGQRTHLSYLDGVTASFLYARDDWRFVDRTFTGVPIGTFLRPFPDFSSGEQSLPVGGTLWIQPGSYSALGAYNKPQTIRAPLGNVTLGN